jgi:putative membrane protein
MSFISRIIIQILANSAAIWTASRFVSGFSFSGSWKELLIAGAILGAINVLVRPIVKLLSFPLILLSLGLFTIIINVALLYFASSFIPGMEINGFWAGFWAVIIISFVNNLITHLFKNSD